MSLFSRIKTWWRVRRCDHARERTVERYGEGDWHWESFSVPFFGGFPIWCRDIRGKFACPDCGRVRVGCRVQVKEAPWRERT